MLEIEQAKCKRAQEIILKSNSLIKPLKHLSEQQWRAQCVGIDALFIASRRNYHIAVNKHRNVANQSSINHAAYIAF